MGTLSFATHYLLGENALRVAEDLVNQVQKELGEKYDPVYDLHISQVGGDWAVALDEITPIDPPGNLKVPEGIIAVVVADNDCDPLGLHLGVVLNGLSVSDYVSHPIRVSGKEGQMRDHNAWSGPEKSGLMTEEEFIEKLKRLDEQS
jgi:hypothetical protein